MVGGYSIPLLTHWGRDKKDAIFQTTFSYAFSWMKMNDIRLKFHWSLFLRFQLTIFQHWLRLWLGADQATSHYLNQRWLFYQRLYASLGLNELTHGDRAKWSLFSRRRFQTYFLELLKYLNVDDTLTDVGSLWSAFIQLMAWCRSDSTVLLELTLDELGLRYIIWPRYVNYTVWWLHVYFTLSLWLGIDILIAWWRHGYKH